MNRLHYGSTKDSDLLYALRYAITDPFFYLETKTHAYAFLSSTDIDAFMAGSASDVEAVDVMPLLKSLPNDGSDQLATLAELILKTYNVTGKIQVSVALPLNIADGLRSAGYELQVVTPWCPERSIKSPADTAAIAQNMHYTVGAFSHFESILQDSVIENSVIIYQGEVLTSERVKFELEVYFLSHDLISPEGLIVSCGSQAAMPHHEGTGELQAHETIIVDLFPQSRVNHYFADMTRTYVKGQPSAKAEAMYAAVADAQTNALAALMPGVAAADIDKLSRDVILQHGFDVNEAGYIHSLGHGLGMSVHEKPNLSARSDAVLEPGQVVTIEPGLYYPEWGGVRIEDTVVITESGFENLTNFESNWIIA